MTGLLVRRAPGVALLVLAVIAAACSQPQPATPRVFAVEGMSCEGCAGTITETLTALPGVQSAAVDLNGKTATVVANERALPDAQIVAAIEKAGYQAARR